MYNIFMTLQFSTTMSLLVLGAFQASINGQPVLDFGYDKVRALLAYLAMESAIPQRREFLATLFWPDQSPEDARHSLSQALLKLRSALRKQDDAHEFILADRDTIQIHPEVNCVVDAGEFSRALADCQAHAHHALEDCPSCLLHLENAINLYRGEFLKGLVVGDSAEFENWLVVYRERLRMQVLGALYHLTRSSICRRNYSLAQKYAWRQIEIEPCREEAHRELMRIFARIGQISASLSQFESCRRILATELGVEPAGETQTLFERVRAAQNGIRCNLPTFPQSFVGRISDLTALEDCLQDSQCRLLSLVGPGGIGKTRLAVRTATEVINEFINGVFFVSMTPVESPEGIASTIADVLRLPISGRETHQSQLTNYLRDKEILLLLDNFEHLLEGAGSLNEILDAAPLVKIMVTTRTRLGLKAEWVFEVTGLPVPEGNLDESAEECDSVQLFRQRARQARAGLTLSDADIPSANLICRLVGGLPLGIELATGWLQYISCREIAEKIQQSSGFLKSVVNDYPERHSSIQALFDQSWKMLSEIERRVLLGLSVFQGEFGGHAAAQVATASLPVICTLVDKSLLRKIVTSVQDAQERFELHPLLKQYAAEKLAVDPEEDHKIRNLHCDYYTTFLMLRKDGLIGAKQRLVLDEISKEIGNIRKSWQWAVEGRKYTQIANSLDSLYLFFETRGWFHEGVESFGTAAAVVESEKEIVEPQYSILLGHLIACLGSFCYRLGLYDKAGPYLLKSLALSQSVESDDIRAFALLFLGQTMYDQGDYQQAETYYQQSLEIERRIQNRLGIARTLKNLGDIRLFALGKSQEAQPFYKESLEISRAIGDQLGYIDTLLNFGTLNYSLGDYPLARQVYQESLDECRKIGYQRGMGIALNNLGAIASFYKDYSEAVRLYQENLDIRSAIGDLAGKAFCLNNLGFAAYEQGNLRDAVWFFQQNLKLSDEIGNRRGVANALCGLGGVYCDTERFREAHSHLTDALKLSIEIQALPLVMVILIVCSRYYARTGREEKAVELIGLILYHPTSYDEQKQQAGKLLANLEGKLPSVVITAALVRGQKKSLALTAEEFAAEKIA